MLEIEPCRRPRKSGAEIQPNITTFQRCNVPTYRHTNVVTSQLRNGTGKSQQTLSLGEAIKGTGEFIPRGSKLICRVRV